MNVISLPRLIRLRDAPGYLAMDRNQFYKEIRRYFPIRAEEVPQTIASDKQITCGECSNFERTNHPCLGHCAMGEPEAAAGIWDTDQRYCEQYKPLINQYGDHYSGLITVPRAEAK